MLRCKRITLPSCYARLYFLDALRAPSLYTTMQKPTFITPFYELCLFVHKLFKPVCLTMIFLFSENVSGEDLLEIHAAILENDPSWLAKQHAYEAGKQSKGLGRAHILPNVIVSGEHKNVTDKPECNKDSSPSCIELEDEYDSTGYQVELVQPLFHKEGWHTYKEGKAQSELAEIEYRNATQSNIYDAAVLYFDVLRAQEDYNLALAEKNALSTQLKEVTAKAEAGVIDQTEVIETQASLDLASVNEITLIGYLKVAYEDLVTRTGISKPTVKRLSPEFPVKFLEPFDESIWVNKAEKNSPNILALKKRVEVAKQSFRRQTSAIYPSINLFANLAHQEQEGGRFVANGESESVGIRVSWPIFAGLGDYYTAKQQRLQYQQSSDEARAEIQEFTQVVRNRFRSIYTDVLSVEARKKSVNSSQRALRAIQAQYDVGARNMIDVLDAQKQLFDAKQAYSHARYDYLLDKMQLKLFVGELSIEDLENVNNWLIDDPSMLNLDTIP